MNLEGERDKLLSASTSAMTELAKYSDALEGMHRLANECAAMRLELDANALAVSRLGEFAFHLAKSPSDIAQVHSLCESVGIKVGTNVPVHAIRGLPRLRVFADEPCTICLVVLHASGERLWSSGPIQVSQSAASPSLWETSAGLSPGTVLKDLFTDARTSRIGIEFENFVVAETQPLTAVELVSMRRLQLFHNDVALSGGELVLSAELQAVYPISASELSLELRVASINDVQFEDSARATDPLSSSPAVSITYSLAETRESVECCVPAAPDHEIPRATLDLTHVHSPQILVDVLVNVATEPVAYAEMRIDRVNFVDTKSIWTALDVNFVAPTGHRNGSISFEYRFRRTRASSTTSAPFRSG